MRVTWKSWRVRAAAALLVALAFVFGAASVAGAKYVGPWPSTPTSSTWVTNNSVYGMCAGPEGSTFIAGDFTRVGPYTGGAALIDTATAEAKPFPEADNTVRVVISDGDGGYFVGGDFDVIGDVRRPKLAHVLSDGTVDTSWNAQLDYGEVRSLAIADGSLFVGGDDMRGFNEQYGGLIVCNLDYGFQEWWGETTTDRAVNGLAVNGNKLYAVGEFTTIGGVPRLRIARFDLITHALDSGLPSVGGSEPGQEVRTIAFHGNTAFVGGYFSTFGGESRSYLASFDVVSGEPTAWAPEPSSSVNHIEISGDTMYVGGSFDVIDEADTAPYLCSFEFVDGTPELTDWDPTPDWAVNDIRVVGDRLVIGGAFNTIEDEYGDAQPRLSAAAYDISGTDTEPVLTDWRPEPMDAVRALAPHAEGVMLCGNFMSGMSVERNGLAQLDGYGRGTDWAPQVGEAWFEGVAYVDSSVYAGGYDYDEHAGLTEFSGVDGSVVATGAEETGIGPLAVDADHVYWGGAWENVLGRSERTDLKSSETTTTDGEIQALKTDAGSLYVGGQFTTLGESETVCVAKIDTATWQKVAWDPKLADSSGGTMGVSVKAIEARGGAIYLGGRFARIGETLVDNAWNLAAFDGETAAVIPQFAPKLNDSVNALGWNGSNLCVVGAFHATNGDSDYGVTQLDMYGLAESRLGYPFPSDSLQCVLVNQGQLYVGGEYDAVYTSNDYTTWQKRSGLASWAIDRPDLPSSIRDFSATAGPGSGEAEISWRGQLPTSYSGAAVYRSTLGPTLSPNGGAGQTLVYWDFGTGFTDTGLIPGTVYFYTAFPFDEDGTWGNRATTRLAVPQAGAQASTMTCLAAPSVVDYNANVSVTGTLTVDGVPKEGAEVQLYVSADQGATWNYVGDGTDTGDGGYSASVPIRSNTYFEWRYAGDIGVAPCDSAGVTFVRCRSALGKPWVSHTPKAGRWMRIGGSIGPKETTTRSVHLTLYRRVHGRWQVWRAPRAKVSGCSTAYSYRLKLPRSGRWRVVASTGDASHAWTRSVGRDFTVQ